LNGNCFNSSQQGYLYQKAKFFHCFEEAEKILWIKNPDSLKSIKIDEIHTTIFNNYKKQLLYQNIHAKFSQNQVLKNILLETDNDSIIVCSITDSIWTIKTNKPIQFKRQNTIGQLLEEVRQNLKTYN
jgi:ribA/ribD-fused uncharacterized protein